MLTCRHFIEKTGLSGFSCIGLMICDIYFKYKFKIKIILTSNVSLCLFFIPYLTNNNVFNITEISLEHISFKKSLKVQYVITLLVSYLLANLTRDILGESGIHFYNTYLNIFTIFT